MISIPFIVSTDEDALKSAPCALMHDTIGQKGVVVKDQYRVGVALGNNGDEDEDEDEDDNKEVCCLKMIKDMLVLENIKVSMSRIYCTHAHIHIYVLKVTHTYTHTQLRTHSFIQSYLYSR